MFLHPVRIDYPTLRYEGLPSHGLTDVAPRHGGGSRHGRCRRFNPRLRFQSLRETAVPRHGGVLVLHAKEQGQLRKEGMLPRFYDTYSR